MTKPHTVCTAILAALHSSGTLHLTHLAEIVAARPNPLRQALQSLSRRRQIILCDGQGNPVDDLECAAYVTLTPRARTPRIDWSRPHFPPLSGTRVH